MGDNNEGAQSLLVYGGAALAIVCIIIAIAVG
jgi:hypothetical protein